MPREIQILRRPTVTFRDVIESPERGVWVLLRRPLLLLFSMGVALSLSSSNRLSARTTVDGMISFLFLPVAGILGVGYTFLRIDRRLPFSRVVDAFFLSNAPWLLWILVFVTWETLTHALTISLTGATAVLATLVVPMLWTVYLDLQLFRIVLSRKAVAVDLIVSRGIAWIFALGYFVGIAAWAWIVAVMR